MVKIRENFLIGMIGTNGTGKTSVTKEIMRLWRRSRPNGKIITYDDFDQFNDADIRVNGRISFNPNWARTIEAKITSSLIVLDDYKNLVDTYTPPDGMRNLLIKRRHQDNDYIYSCHSPIDVLPQIVPFTTHFYIFYTKSVGGTWKDRLPFADLLIPATLYVNNYVSIHGKGKHIKDLEYDGQGFPYAIVDTTAGTVTMRNMNKKLIIN